MKHPRGALYPRKCSRCGIPQAAEAFAKTNRYQAHRSACKRCGTAETAAWRSANPVRKPEPNTPDTRARSRREWRAAQSKSLILAGRRYTTWAGWELERISDYSLSARKHALNLHRTVAAVSTMRFKIRKDPATIARAGLSEDTQ